MYLYIYIILPDTGKLEECRKWHFTSKKDPGPQAANPTPSTNHKALAGKPAGATPVLYGVTGVLLIPWERRDSEGPLMSAQQYAEASTTESS